ncbi:MAG: ABC transporter permease [Fimbriimonadales bacterium]
MSKPLAPWAFLLRNPGKSTPLVLVIMLAVLLIAGVVTVMNSIPLSIRTVYSFSRFMTGVTPRGDAAFLPELRAHFDKSPAPIERMVSCRTVGVNVKSIVGPWPFVLYGFHKRDIDYAVGKFQLGSLRGRLPASGEPEVVITEPLTRNLDLKLGDSILGPKDEKNYSPYNVKVVGIFDSKEWFAFSSYEYVAANHFPPIDVLMLFAKNQTEQRRLDAWTETSLKGQKAVTFTYPTIEKDTRETFQVLFKILNIVIGLLVLVITIMMGMLINIFLSQRIVEFGLLQAIGFTRRFLIRRAILESIIFVVSGWLLGAGLVFALLSIIKATLMDPRAYSLNPYDPRAYAYTLSIPLVILLAAAFTVWFRFRHFDPISVVERRVV